MTSVNLTETEQLIATIVPINLVKILMKNLACQTQKKGSECGVVYREMDFLLLTFSMKQSQVQRINKCWWIMHGFNYKAKDCTFNMMGQHLIMLLLYVNGLMENFLVVGLVDVGLSTDQHLHLMRFFSFGDI